jgi:hypothetical protein
MIRLREKGTQSLKVHIVPMVSSVDIKCPAIIVELTILRLPSIEWKMCLPTAKNEANERLWSELSVSHENFNQSV